MTTPPARPAAPAAPVKAKAEAEDVTFTQYQLPGLPAGVYELDVSVHVNASDGSAVSDQPMANSYRFAVIGDRFSLGSPAGAISALYPADNATGKFDATFPHVVLTKPGLPWIRYPTLKRPAPDNKHPGVPTWLAVLVLDDTDVDPAKPFDLVPAVARTGDLFPVARWSDSKLRPDTYSYFARPGDAPSSDPAEDDLEPGQALTDPITVIDLPLTLFAAIAPTVADLELTAHVRTVSLMNKPTAAGTAVPGEPTGTFSVVMSNRLPQAQLKSRAYLVSLEGLEPLLPTDDSGQIAKADMSRNIRLAVLAHWTFFSAGSPAAFDDLLHRLNGRQHADDPPAEVTSVRLHHDKATGVVATALAKGYVPLDHDLRAGGQTVSWYRGPLSATPAPAQTPPAQTPPALPIPSPDAVVAFDPTTGMLDVSLAAAWTLGRLMALDDTTFSTALYNWKQGRKREAVTKAELRLIEREFGVLVAREGAANAASLPLLHHAMSLLARSEAP
jgi:hypothetical protein